MASGDSVDTIEVAETSFMRPAVNKGLTIINEVDTHREGERMKAHKCNWAGTPVQV